MDVAARGAAAAARRAGNNADAAAEADDDNAGGPLRPQTPQSSLSLLWYRPFDLRTDDHLALLDAARAAAVAPKGSLLPFFALNERRELCPPPPPRAPAVPRTGPHRLRHRLEALDDLRARLAALGSGLVVRAGAPEAVLVGLLEEVAAAVSAEEGEPRAAVLVFHREVPAPPLDADDEQGDGKGDADDDDADDDAATAELRVAAAFVAAARRLGYASTVRRHWGAATLHHPVREVAAWLPPPPPSPTPTPKPTPTPPADADEGAEPPSPIIQDADGDGGAEDACLKRLPASFSTYKRALEAGALRQGGAEAAEAAAAAAAATAPKKKKNGPPLSAMLPSAAPLAAPQAPLPPLPAPFCDDEGSLGALPTDVYALYELAGPEALAGLRELSRLVGAGGGGGGGGGSGANGDDPFSVGMFGPDAIVPAYACRSAKDEAADAVEADGVRHPRADPRSAFPFAGGETAAAARLAHVLRRVLAPAGAPAGALPASYGKGRMMATGVDASAKLSPYLAAGCLSPRRVAAALRGRSGGGSDGGGGDGVDADEDALWLLSHLVIRDWYVLSGWQRSRGRRRGAAAASGKERPSSAATPPPPPPPPLLPPAFEAWARGRSGLSPFVDASMRELAATGWQSNRSRQNAASALAHEVSLPSSAPPGEGDDGREEQAGAGAGAWAARWALGARLFECLLIDGDRSANRGNWLSVSGKRGFDAAAQAARYDGEGALAAAWLGERMEGAAAGATTAAAAATTESDGR